MSLLFLLLMPSACILLQALSKNLIYVLVAAGCILAAISVLLGKTKARWWGLILALGANTMMLQYSVRQHINFGGIMTDYVLSAIIIGITMLMAIIEAIPSKNANSIAPEVFLK
jgi:hypothetical protein